MSRIVFVVRSCQILQPLSHFFWTAANYADCLCYNYSLTQANCWGEKTPTHVIPISPITHCAWRACQCGFRSMQILYSSSAGRWYCCENGDAVTIAPGCVKCAPFVANFPGELCIGRSDIIAFRHDMGGSVEISAE